MHKAVQTWGKGTFLGDLSLKYHERTYPAQTPNYEGYVTSSGASETNLNGCSGLYGARHFDLCPEMSQCRTLNLARHVLWQIHEVQFQLRTLQDGFISYTSIQYVSVIFKINCYLFCYLIYAYNQTGYTIFALNAIGSPLSLSYASEAANQSLSGMAPLRSAKFYSGYKLGIVVKSSGF